MSNFYENILIPKSLTQKICYEDHLRLVDILYKEIPIFLCANAHTHTYIELCMHACRDEHENSFNIVGWSILYVINGFCWLYLHPTHGRRISCQTRSILCDKYFRNLTS